MKLKKSLVKRSSRKRNKLHLIRRRLQVYIVRNYRFDYTLHKVGIGSLYLLKSFTCIISEEATHTTLVFRLPGALP